MRRLLCILTILLVSPWALAQTTTRNFIKSTTFQVRTTTGNVATDEKIETINYFDGLGRPLQRIDKQAGGNKQDIITPYGFDYFGRQKREYLPYARTGSSLNFETNVELDYQGDIYDASFFYATKYPDDFQGLYADVNSFSEKYFEASPLNRIRKQAAPGDAWKLNKFSDNDHTIKFEYYANDANDNVKLFKIYFTNENKEAPYLEQQGIYTNLQLYKTITKNENWTSGKNDTTEEFKDKEGHVILKRSYSDYKDSNGQLISSQTPHDTYYVYDRYGNLTFVIPPKAADLIGNTSGIPSDPTSTAVLTANSGPLNIKATNSIQLLPGFHAMAGSTFSAVVVNGDQAILDNLCYQYKYDSRNRLVEKKIPGKDWEYIIYDKLDRPVLTQDANLRAQNKWIFTKYDIFSRPVYTGEYVNSGQVTRTGIQNLANTNNVLFENRLSSPIAINGTSSSYSNQAFPDSGIDLLTINYYDNYNNIDLDGGIAVATYNVTPITNAKGLSTCSKVRTLGTSLWTTSVIYYDTKGRAVYTYSKNNFLNTINTTKNYLDFAGKLLTATTTHQKTGAPNITISDVFTYDHMGRMLGQKQTINNQPQEIIVANTYDNLGQLVTKTVGGVQTVNYKYNVRGWLKDINDVNNMGNSLFAFKVNYDKPTTGTSLFNGNISQTLWKTAHNDTSLRSYVYEYDALNRLTAAKDNLDRYNENPTYDKNGNIMTMFRNGNTILNTSNYGIIDNLVYSYDTGNKLLKVEDNANNAQGFNNGNSGTNIDYSYDANGNMVTDANKGVTAISYNYLNLPVQITMQDGNINYTYDAAGVKQRKVVKGITTDYAAGFQYENNVMQFFSQPEGYVRNNSGVYEYIYQYKDHLGNVRLSYNKNLNIIEENNYYPFGLEQKSHPNIISTLGNAIAQKYKYNGKELQDELGLNFYDYGARNYDPALSRFMNLDPMTEKRIWLSPYNYVQNNPILKIDPDGMLDGDYFDSEGNYMGSDDVNDKKIYIVNNPTSPLEMKKNSFNSPANFYNKDGTVNRKVGLKSSTEITEINSLEDKGNFAEGVLNYYYEQAGYNLKELKANGITDDFESGLALTRYGGVSTNSSDLKKGEIDISVTYGHLGIALQNGHDIINLFSHERGQHVEDYKKLGKGIYDTRYEYNAYMHQFQDKSWKATSPIYKEYIQSVAGKYIHHSETTKYFKK
jgi:RHS repeat-associated protein